MLLQEFWDDRYVGYCERLREVTRVGYESAWRCHVEPVFGSMELADIGVDDIELWLSGFASPGAARKAWAVLRQMLRKAAKWGYLEVDVTRLEIDLPAKPLYVPRLLTIGQTRRQLQGFYGHALEAWLIVDSCLALRPEEGYGVDWADIDMRSGITHIQRGVQWVAGHEVVVPPKTELSDRFLPLPRFAVRRLREIRNGRKGRIIGDLTPSQAARRYASWCKKESLPYVPVQNLRHSWATNALEAGVNIAVVSKFLGHTDIKTTARFYLRPEIASLKEAQSIWERALIGQWDSLTPAEYAPYIQCGGHTVTTGDDGTFWVGVKSPNGKPPDYASYTVGPFGTGFNDEDGIIAHLWDVTATGVRFRLYTTRYQRWCGKTAIFGKWITVWRR
ncbi:MAG: tyrosine recombinase XerC [Bifidobacterium adolescentis]